MAFGAMVTILVTRGDSVRWTLNPTASDRPISNPRGNLGPLLTLLIDRFVYRYHRERKANQ